MSDRSTLRWFARGFGLTMLVGLAVLAAVRPGLGLAQGDLGNLASAPRAGGEGAASSGETDDPLGRSTVPLPEGSALAPNRAAGRDAAGAPAPLTPEEAVRREAQAVQLQASPLMIPAADFRDDGFVPDSQRFYFHLGYQQGVTAPAYGCMMAPAYLPNEVHLTELFASVWDNDANPDEDVEIKLWRVNNFDGAVDEMAQASTSGAQQGIVVINDITIDFPDTLYPDYSYYVTTCLTSPDLRLYSVRLYYTQP
jgi:hypothetical protein